MQNPVTPSSGLRPPSPTRGEGYREKKLLIAGGGTGGHLFSGIAVAEEWHNKGGDAVFVGTERGLEKNLVPRYGFPLELIPVGSLKGTGVFHKLKTFLRLPRSFIKSFALLKKVKPAVVLGIGGYASGPVVLAAALRGIPTAILDQNSVPGLTNRILGRWAGEIFLNFEVASSYFKGRPVKVVGNPVIRSRRGPGPGAPFGGKISAKEGVTLLVCGGSQGAHALNENFLEAVEKLRQDFPGIRVIHQTGPADAEKAGQVYREKKVTALVSPFFDNMEEYYRVASLVIARAGAGTLTELAAWGLPSILVPYPFAADGHQLKNAEVFEKAGASEIVEQKNLTGIMLADKIGGLLKNPERLNDMGKRALALNKPDAARDVVDVLMKM